MWAHRWKCSQFFPPEHYKLSCNRSFTGNVLLVRTFQRIDPMRGSSRIFWSTFDSLPYSVRVVRTLVSRIMEDKGLRKSIFSDQISCLLPFISWAASPNWASPGLDKFSSLLIRTSVFWMLIFGSKDCLLQRNVYVVHVIEENGLIPWTFLIVTLIPTASKACKIQIDQIFSVARLVTFIGARYH